MKLDFGALFEQLVDLFAKLPLAQKIALPLLIAAGTAVVYFVVGWAGQPDYKTLFSGLQDADAAAIVERLKDQKVAFKLSHDGSTVQVSPPELAHELRLELAAGGLPRNGSVGFELFDQAKLGQTAFQESLNFKRGLEGELERTIASIAAVKAVRIHVTTPQRSVFVKRDVAPTASVLLHLRPGDTLTKDQVRGIANLVAGSVERLTTDNVTIVDSQGNQLSTKNDNPDLNEADITRIDYQRKIEANYERRVESMLGEVLGHGRVVARVTAELDFSQYEKEEEAFDPGGQVTRSERTLKEAAGSSAEGGIPGVISNLTNDPGVLTPPDSTDNQNVRNETVKNYEVSRAVSRTKSAVGKLLRLSVAVLVDGQRTTVAATEEGADPVMAYAGLSAEMLRKIDSLVKQAIGFDSTRGDTVTVENMQFTDPDPALAKALEEAASIDWWQMVANGLGPAVLAFMLLFIIYRISKNLVAPTDAELDLSRLLPAGIEELEAELQAERGKLASIDESSSGVNIHELEEILAENSRMVKENPQQAALLIRYWLNEGRV